MRWWLVKLIEGVSMVALLHSFTMLSAQQSLCEFIHTIVAPCFQTDGPLKGLQNRLLTLLLPRQSSIQTCNVGDEQQSISSGFYPCRMGQGRTTNIWQPFAHPKAHKSSPHANVCFAGGECLHSSHCFHWGHHRCQKSVVLASSLSAHHHTVEDVSMMSVLLHTHNAPHW